ncbi:hypothetical protein EYF80_066075 [Liparis tanakae]|uniref:Uncharacterized protein n=1 Tax=Liparis tanakae TaxID=230148 RepID=A0A4Z2E634_9TELE|nr:hypothetical protein EYF80_066075 [Liparis tanakae]
MTSRPPSGEEGLLLMTSRPPSGEEGLLLMTSRPPSGRLVAPPPPVVLVQLLEHAAVDDLLLPAQRHGAGAELLVELLVFGLEGHVLRLRLVPEALRVAGVDHVGPRRPGRRHKPRLQAPEVDALEEEVVPRVVAVAEEDEQEEEDEESLEGGGSLRTGWMSRTGCLQGGGTSTRPTWPP